MTMILVQHMKLRAFAWFCLVCVLGWFSFFLSSRLLFISCGTLPLYWYITNKCGFIHILLQFRRIHSILFNALFIMKCYVVRWHWLNAFFWIILLNCSMRFFCVNLCAVLFKCVCANQRTLFDSEISMQSTTHTQVWRHLWSELSK